MTGIVDVQLIPGKRVTITVDGATSVKEALQSAQVAFEGKTIQVNGKPVDPAQATVSGGDRVTVASEARGA